jgi:hypothetical protein
MDVFRHHDISHNDEPVALAGLFQDGEQSVAAARRTQKWRSAITRTRDKVQLVGAVVATPAARHGELYRIGIIAAHPCKKRKHGAPTFRYWENKTAHGEG